VVKTVLAIAACGPRLEVALSSPGAAVPGVVALAGPTPRSELVMAAVDLLLRAAGLERSGLEGVVAARGPGSFTGVRVALATAQGLATALGIPSHGFSSLLMQAARTDLAECVAIQPARRGSFYVQRFTRRGGELEPAGDAGVVSAAEIAALGLPAVAPEGLALPPGTPTAPTRLSTGEALIELLAREPRPEPATLAPLYLEPPPAIPPAAVATACPPSPKAS
jgi:tRNA threonylcarbamoyl adenosine modification protein YeaZ